MPSLTASQQSDLLQIYALTGDCRIVAVPAELEHAAEALSKKRLVLRHPDRKGGPGVKYGLSNDGMLLAQRLAADPASVPAKPPVPARPTSSVTIPCQFCGHKHKRAALKPGLIVRCRKCGSVGQYKANQEWWWIKNDNR